MKRINKNKVYAFIGRAVVYASGWALAVIGTAWALTRTVIY